MSDNTQETFRAAIAAIDDANAEDPNTVTINGTARPAELVYSERMSVALVRFAPDAPEPLRLAARAQHLRRWQLPRRDYPMDRTGYLRWRTELKNRHANQTADILAACGYGEDTIARVKSLIRKERPKSDPDSQTLEDVICHVFLQFYLADFAAKHEDSKIIDILRKTWGKMSAEGQQAALALPLADDMKTLVGQALKS
ncbi:MAG: DUF4202 domain-containing protein [Proteobacteria bacterium]|jgi:hypothetical protein|nr:DUF4202 domain-containing protein [Pseudomonadota bacterium]